MKDLTGRRFGRLVVIGFFEKRNKNGYYWNCVCDCGKKIAVRSGNLTGGYQKSCGCFHGEKKKHGLSKTKIYGVWNGMKQRCLNSNTLYWENYGGKGITVCKEWLDFKNFYVWAMANGYAENLTIDRIDSNGNYEPDNCQWITGKENTHRAGACNPNNKILCVETGKIYNTTTEASIAVGLKNPSSISEALMFRKKFGQIRTAGGYTWDRV